MEHGRRILGNPPGTVPVHPVGSVAVHLDLDPYLSLDALASTRVKGERVPGYLGISRRTLQDLVNDADDPLPTYRIGARLLARRSEVDAWMARRRNRKPLAAARLAAADAHALLAARPKNPAKTS